MDGELISKGPGGRGRHERDSCTIAWTFGPLALGTSGGRPDGNCLRLAFSIRQWLWEAGLEHQPGPKQGTCSSAALTYRRSLRPSTRAKPGQPSSIDKPSVRQLRVIDAVASLPLHSSCAGSATPSSVQPAGSDPAPLPPAMRPGQQTSQQTIPQQASLPQQ